MLSKKIDLERNRPLSRKRQAFFPSVFFLELSNLMKGLHHLCWNSETSELLYNNGFKNTTETQFFCNPPIWGFFSAILSAYVYVGYFANTKVHMSLYWMTAVRTRLFVELVPERDRAQHRRRERGFLKPSGQIPTSSLDATFSALLFTSPL